MSDIDQIKDLMTKPYYHLDKELNFRLKHVLERKFSPICENSTILDNDLDEGLLLMEWLGYSEMQTSFLMKATESGFESTKFHEKVGGKKEVLVLIKAKSGKRFGGFAKGGWKAGGEYYADEGSFLFSLTHKTKHEQTGSNGQYGLYSNTTYSATWGGGHDIHICNNANTVNSSYSNLGFTYKT